MATTELRPRFRTPTGTSASVAQTKGAFRKIINVATTTTMLVEPVPVVQSSLPTAAVAGSSGCVPTDNFTCARLLFGGVGTANQTLQYQVVLWYPGPVISGANELTFIPLIIAKGTAVLGASTYTTDDMGASTSLWADIITEERGHAGVFVNSPEDDSKAWLDIDLHNAAGIEVEVDRGGNTTTDVMLQFGEVPASAVGGWGTPSSVSAVSNEMYLWLDGATGTDALVDKTPVAALDTMSKTSAASNPATTGAIYTEGNQHATITFGGVGAGGTINYQVYGWKEIRAVAGTTQCYWPEKIAAGQATLGTATYTQDEIGAGTELICDAMTETTNNMRAFVQPAPDNEICSLHLDITNFMAIEVETDLGTATACDVLGQLGANPSPFDSVSVVGHAEDTETSSLHGKIGTDTELGDQSLYDRIGAYTGPAAGAEADDNIKAALDIVDTNVDTLTTNLALVSGYTQYDGWRVASKSISANPGTTPGTVLFTLTATASMVVELQVFGIVTASITGTLVEILAIKTEDGTTLIAATTATALTMGLLWYDNDPDVSVEPSSSAPTCLFAAHAGNNTILLEQSGADPWDTGGLIIYCRWRPIHASGSVTAS